MTAGSRRGRRQHSRPAPEQGGSRNPADAARLPRIVATAGRQAGVCMVVQAGWAGLGSALQDDDGVIVIGEAPHDWLFPRWAPSFITRAPAPPRPGCGPGSQLAASRRGHGRDQRRREPRLVPQPGTANSEASRRRRQHACRHQGTGPAGHVTFTARRGRPAPRSGFSICCPGNRQRTPPCGAAYPVRLTSGRATAAVS